METFDDYDLVVADQKIFTKKIKNIWRLGVVVFTRPEDRLCQEIIGPSLRYLHELTGDKVHFYFVGFCDGKGFGHETEVSTDFFGDGTKWFFSYRKFSQVQSRFETLTNRRWCYSGATDLLIVPYRIWRGTFYVDPSKAIDIKLSKLAKHTKHYMPEEIIQILVRHMKQGKDIDGVSNAKVMDAIKEGFKQSLLSLLPGGLSDSFDVLEPFVITKLM